MGWGLGRPPKHLAHHSIQSALAEIEKTKEKKLVKVKEKERFSNASVAEAGRRAVRVDSVHCTAVPLC